MQKKSILIVVVVILVVITCMSLVACGGGSNGSNNGGNNQEEIIGGENNKGDEFENEIGPNVTIEEFLKVWRNSTKKSYSAYGMTMVINNNILYQYDDNIQKWIEITGRNKANYFYGIYGSTDLNDWEILKLKTIEEICDYINIELESLLEVNSPKDIVNLATSMLFEEDNLDEMFEQNGNTFYGKENTPYEGSTITIVDNELIYPFSVQTSEGVKIFEFKFKLGSEPITIPEFLREAINRID